MQNKLLEAKQAYDRAEYELCLTLANDVLDKQPNNEQALFIMGSVFIQTRKRGLAHNLLARCLAICEKAGEPRAEVWMNYGRTLEDDPTGWAETEYCQLKALDLNPRARGAMENMSALENQRCNPEAAVMWADRALALAPDAPVALASKGFALLMLGQWPEAWRLYHSMVGRQGRPDTVIGDLPEWDGTPGMSVVVTGEQGVGDELVYNSVIPCMAKDCRYVVLDGMERLAALMRNSMPDNVYVSGQRWSDTLEIPDTIQPEARITAPGVCMYYRNSDEDFPGTPYLRADSDARVAMRAMLDSFGHGLKVGIAWTGGAATTRAHLRESSLEALTPILRTPGVQWFSLQYKEAQSEIKAYEEARGIRVHHFPWVTELKEYGLTAAMVAELDLVISVPTSVVQLAGGMGVPVMVMVPEITGWLYARNKYVWADSVKIYRDRPPGEVAADLQTFINDHRQAAA
jgi:tetratricopeptide (TPR) repeat protein